MRKLSRWLDANFEGFVMGVFLVVITVVIFLQVIMRYLFNHALPWPEELTRYCFVCSTLLSLSYCVKHRSMMRVDALVSLLPKSAQGWIELVVQLIALALYVVLFVFSLDTTKLSLGSGQKSTALRLPMYWIYGWGSFSFAMVVFRAIQSVVRQVKTMFFADNGKEASL